MASTHPNKTALDAAVTRWIDEASRRPNGPELLDAKADVLERYLRELSDACAADRDPPAHLVGLTAWDLSTAMTGLRAAANKQRPAAQEAA